MNGHRDDEQEGKVEKDHVGSLRRGSKANHCDSCFFSSREAELSFSLAEARDGIVAIRLPRRSNQCVRFLRPRITAVWFSGPSLCWKSKHKREGRARVMLDDIRTIAPGQTTAGFARYRRYMRGLEDSSLSIFYSEARGRERSLDLVFLNAEDCCHFRQVLENVVKITQGKTRSSRYLHMLWDKADTNGDNLLDKGEIRRLVHVMGLPVNMRFVDELFQQIDTNKDGVLDFDEFLALVHRVRTRPELLAAWKLMLAERWEEMTAWGGGTTVTGTDADWSEQRLPLSAFHHFRVQVQGESMASLQDTRELVVRLNPGGEDEGLSFLGFVVYVQGVDNDVLEPRRSRGVWQDMGRPLGDYFIASSHNTYLEGDQLQSASSVSRYIKDLNSGCRCVEIDCWNGPDGEPMVTHGKTLTSSILFRDVITAVATYAFHASPYPVILSLENHCDVPQQRRMVHHLRTLLGDRLALPPPAPKPNSPTPLPSPAALAHKVLIKTRLEADTAIEAPELEEDANPRTYTHSNSNSDSSSASSSLGVSTPSCSCETPIINTGGGEAKEQSPVENPSLPAPVDPVPQSEPRIPLTSVPPCSAVSRESTASSSPDKAKANSSKKKKGLVLAQELADITWMPGIRFPGLDALGSCEGRSCTSVEEPKMLRFLSEPSGSGQADWVRLNRRLFSRVYPANLRISSSNFNPVPAWCVGVQMVALNYQTPGLEMQLNQGRFRENGQCGYVLKPAYLRDPDVRFSPLTGPFSTGLRLRVTIVSAQQLPRPPLFSPPMGGSVAMSPFVRMHLFGVPSDVRHATTPTVPNNGFNPVWRCTCHFRVCAPELAVLHLGVWGARSGVEDDFIAATALPVSCLRPGLRRVQLHSAAGHGGSEFEHASLLVHVTIENTADVM